MGILSYYLNLNIKDIQEVIDLCNIIIKSFEKPNIVDGKKIYLTASIGISLSPDHGIDYNTLLKNADAAMYKAKRMEKMSDLFNDSISDEFNKVYSLQKGSKNCISK